MAWIDTYQPVTENSEAGFFIDTFDENGNPTGETIKLNAADPATYEAEKLFGLDLNGDNVQGRNVQKFDRAAFITEKNISTFAAVDSKALLTDINSGELLAADPNDISIQTLLINNDKNGTSFKSADHHTAIDVEKTDDGTIRLLQYRAAHETTTKVRKIVGGRWSLVDESETVPPAFVITSFDSNGKLIQEDTILKAADPLTYEAEKLFGIDINGDLVEGRNVQKFDRAAFINQKNIYFIGTTNTKTLLTDLNSGELLAADPNDISIQTLLINNDKNSTSFKSADHHTAIDVEKTDDGTIRLLQYRAAHETTKKVRKIVNRRWTMVDESETVPAAFVITTFDSNGKLIQEDTILKAADPATYEAEKLFGLDLNNDNVLGRNIKPFDRDAYITLKNISKFDSTSNKTLLTDVNSREIFFSGLTPVDSTLLTFTDGTSFIPTATQTAIDIEKADDGTIRLLTYREAGEAIKLAPKKS